MGVRTTFSFANFPTPRERGETSLASQVVGSNLSSCSTAWMFSQSALGKCWISTLRARLLACSKRKLWLPASMDWHTGTGNRSPALNQLKHRVPVLKRLYQVHHRQFHPHECTNLALSVRTSHQAIIMESVPVKDARVSSGEASRKTWFTLVTEKRTVSSTRLREIAASTADYRSVLKWACLKSL